MPEFDVTLPVTLTFKVEAADAEKAAWALRHAFDSRHAFDPMAGILVPVGHVESATVMTCTFDALDRDSVVVGAIDQVAPPRRALDPLDVLARAESFISGFEGDEMQTGVDMLLSDIRAALRNQQSE